MKTIGSILLAAGLVFSPDLLHAQTVSVGSFNNDLGPVQTTQPDSIVQITAEAEGLSQIDPTTLPLFASCYWTVYPGTGPVPMPCPPQDLSVPIYQIVDGYYLVDETGGAVSVNVSQTGTRAMTSSAVASAVDRQGNAIANLIEQVQATAANQQTRMMARAMGMDVPSPGGDDGGGSYSPDGITNSYVAPDYGTNLWIAQTAVAAGSLTGIGTNTIADVKYEIQSRTNLVQTDWQSEGFIWGSELTNWTPLSVAQIGRTNLFIRLKSWADDGSGLPIWWQLQYFGTTGVNPNGDPMGDGYSNIQKFQDGMNPNVFYTPPAPSGVTVTYNGGDNSALVNWSPSPGPVTSYTVTSTYYPPYGTGGTTETQTFTVAANETSLTDDTLLGDPNPWEEANYPTTFKIQANYAGGNSAWSPEVPLQTATFSGAIVAGHLGNPFLLVSSLPADTATFRLTELNVDALNWWNTDFYITNIDISIGSFSNGMCQLPNWTQTNNIDGYYWIGRAVATNGDTSAAIYLAYDQFTSPRDNYQTISLVPPFYDGRAQLKQNLIFQLRSASVDAPFHFFIPSTNVYDGGTFGDYVGRYNYPTNYAYAGLYPFSNPSQYSDYDFSGYIDVFWPFEENYLFRNFVFTPADSDESGNLTTGVSSDTYSGYPLLYRPISYQCPTNFTSYPALLPPSGSGWVFYNQSDEYSDNAYSVGLFNVDYGSSSVTFSMTNGYRNWFGLAYTSADVAYDGLDSSYNDLGLTTNLLSAGNSLNSWVFFYSTPNAYPATAVPLFKTVKYDFWQPGLWSSTAGTWAYPLPGDPSFSPTNTSPPLFAAVGNTLSLAGYAKLEVTNSLYSGVYGYLGQYFDTAYKMTNGVASPTATGVLSPYGQFFATEPGPTALLTMADLDTGAHGTCAVYTVSVVLDRNQGSNMVANFNSSDTTSQANPMNLWVDDNYDRGHTVDGSDFEQDDLGAVDIAKLPAAQQVPDFQYTTNGFPAIPSTRDLEDYFRLWTPGLAAAMSAMPAGYTAQLTLTGGGQIRIFAAIESNGGTNYLFDETTASNQVANSSSLYVGLLTSNAPVILTSTNEHFIFCGAQRGSAQVDLQILDAGQNVIADAPAFLQIKNIKEMYERWTVGDNAGVAPLNVATNDASDLPNNPPVPAFVYPAPLNTNTPYILLVHGWNMQRWEKDRFAETAYKRLYWQGYRGRFGICRWPTGNGFDGSWSDILFDSRNYDNSERTAWLSAKGLTNLLTKLNAEYPSHTYLMAHSMGNVVAGEALRLASSQLVNTYVAMQGAIPSHTYDPIAPTRSLGIFDSDTPNCYANYYTSGSPCYFNGTAGAGSYVNFYNTNDYALDKWIIDQNYKPDNGTSPGYHYDSSSGFYKIIGTGSGSTTYLSFPGDTYEIFAYADEARCFALGAQLGINGAFGGRQLDLQTIWPSDTHLQPKGIYSGHVWHSGEFRDDFSHQANYWNNILNDVGFNLK